MTPKEFLEAIKKLNEELDLVEARIKKLLDTQPKGD